MRLVRGALVVLLACLATAPVGLSQESRESELRAKVGEFLRTNIPGSGYPDRDQKIIPHVDRILAAGRNPAVLIGANRTARNRGIYMMTHAGELHSFELTIAQERGLGLRPLGIIINGYNRQDTEQRLAKPVVKLSNLKLDDAHGAPGNKPIAGSIVCQPTGEPINGALSLAIAVKRPENMTRTYTPLDGIPVSGVIPISVPALPPGDAEMDFGPTLVFVDLLFSPSDGQGKSYLAGNTVATIVEVQPDVESFARMGMQSMKKFADLFASVRDRESAARAKEQYVQNVIKMEQLVKAMERLGPRSPQEDAEFERRHGAELQAIAERLQAEVTRLEQADYAGPAFFDEIQRAVNEARQ